MRNTIEENKQSQSYKGSNNSQWKGGIRTVKGYKYIWKPEHPNAGKQGYILAHRLIYEHYLKILFDEDVFIPIKYPIHHIDKNSKNNSLINLQFVLSNSDHRKLHKIDMSNRTCLLCKSKETYIKLNGRPEWHKYNDGFICKKCFWRTDKIKDYNRKRLRISRLLKRNLLKKHCKI